MKVSVVVSTFNSIKYIESQLESLQNQTFKDYEVIISDDNSSDETKEFVKSFISKNELENWHFYENDQNVGYVLNFKRGISKANGELIFLCDHDDIWCSNKLADIVKIFDKKKNVNLIGTSFIFIDGDGNNINQKKGLLDMFTSNNRLIKYHSFKNRLNKLSFKKVFTYSFTPGCCMAFRAKYKDNIINSFNVAPHDYLLSAYFSNMSSLYFYNKPYIFYRIHNNNQIGIKDKNDLNERISVCQKDIKDKEDILNNLELSKSNLKYAKKHIKFLYSRKEALEEKNKKKIRKLLFKSLFMKRYFYTMLKDLKTM